VPAQSGFDLRQSGGELPEDDLQPRMVFDEVGQGEPTLVFLHGLLGLKEHWRPTVQRLSNRARCLMLQAPLLEMRGPACSVDGVTSLTIDALSSRLRGPAVFIGNSLGGHLALRIALERPDMVSGLVLAGSSGLFERTYEKDVQHRPSREWIHRKISDLFYDPSKMPEGVVDRAHEELSQRRAARALVKLSRSAKADHMGERLGMVEAPTLLLWGKQDTVTPPSVAEEFASNMPSARVRWIDRCGHAPMIECPEAFAEGVNAFLDALDTWPEPAGAGAQQEVA